MYRLCIFDLDGTLTDTLDSLTFSVNETLKEMGLLPVTADKCRQFVGNGARVLMERSLLEAGETDLGRLDEAMRIYGRIFDANCTYHVVPYKGIPELLTALRQEGLKLAVLSNKPHRQTVHVAEAVFGRDVFWRIQGQKENIPRKPNPQAALQIAEELGISPEDTVYIGDSEVDIATGTNAHMKTIGVAWGFRGRSVLLEAGAEHIASSPEEIIKLIKE
ncbi:HAD family hydrolase [Schaedlerella arabinosiphila]|uniref:HAD family hydrolase n=1 Tax=Schaedlerella arabinosiphila TaxID=2044587 RepID=A0A9X5CBR5_9FIRM|nr:HAD family hydrolase [Schaedlerella arabinosiphila]KAI4444608.1 Phosphoglycolate phosphatase [Schaedlerella arabinosiphila]NDO71749.1 HAD family hydrolase [Schaedlerella arabinosiphila]